ncbi:MAG: undecaprenyl/decaprenyl-phosphate alpha-N-acetylglucosaminyl 1-phosphate transferase [Candidatus Eisenbacteria bacterium]|nr:undecaprenyl/decaprenyl-phosphate alpha-N-acetylglucosaminyl 1-phosphate transferase [Candidatus Eisenbacteria bacterium]
MPYSLSIALAACAASLLLTPLVTRFARGIGALDHPGPRRVHREPVPTLGGLALIATVLGAAWLARALPGPARALDPRPLLGLTLAAIPVAALGVFDDLRGVPPLVKIGVQICAALVLSLFGYGVTEITNPLGGTLAAHALGLPLTVIWVLIVMNAINLIDGLDGLAAGVVALAAATLWWVGREHGDFYVMFVSAILLGSTLGFLRMNFPPARVFMGDTGSQFLGLTLAAVSLLENRKGTTAVTLLLPIVALGLPILDSTMAFARRLIAGRPVFHGDSEHIHHRLLRLGLPMRSAVALLWGLCAMLSAAAVLLEPLPRRTAGWLAMLLALVVLVVFEGIQYQVAKRERSNGGAAIPD